ncbi:MAG TPA: tyrosine-type recombinase/integrase [Ktedonobacteraceae bacterium]|jgi:integrase/recombinase XerD
MLQDVVDEYLASLSVEHISPEGLSDGLENQNTVGAYRNDLGQTCAYLARRGIQNWQQVTREHLAGYLLEMRENRGYRPATVARRLAALKTFFRYLRASGLVATDPLEHFEAPRIPREPPHTLSPEQIASLFQQVDLSQPAGRRDFAMLQLLYATGMRVSELVALNLADVHPDQHVVICPGLRAGNRHERTLPLSESALGALQCYLEGARPPMAGRHPEEQALFLNHHGERLTRQGFWLIIKGYARQAGITDITPHRLRHSFAVLMLREGMELRSVQELLGHAHISTTQVYSQVAEQV